MRSSAMRIFDGLFSAVVIGWGFALSAAPALAFDGTKSVDGASAAVPGFSSPVEAFRSGTQWLKTDKAKAVNSLEYAAEKGHALAQWKLGRMYAEGDGVPQDDRRAFD